MGKEKIEELIAAVDEVVESAEPFYVGEDDVEYAVDGDAYKRMLAALIDLGPRAKK